VGEGEGFGDFEGDFEGRLEGEELCVGDGDLLFADGDGDGEGTAETVAVTVTCVGIVGVPTAPAASWGGEDGEAAWERRKMSRGARATPTAIEVSSRRRDGGQGETSARALGCGASGVVTYALPAQGSRPSASAVRGESRRADSS